MKKIIIFLVLISSSLFLSGCSFPSFGKEPPLGGVLKSFNGGKEWERKVVIDEEKSIGRTDVLSMIMHPVNPNILYIGTMKSGLFVTRDGADTWEKIKFPPIKNYGLVINHFEPEILYASGSWRGRGKIYKTTDAGENWEEIYTEPADGTIIASLAISKTNPQVLFAGTSKGVIIKSSNGGKTWENFFDASGPVVQIRFDSRDSSTVYFTTLEDKVFITRDGGGTFTDLNKVSEDKNGVKISDVYSIAIDSSNSGTAYIGTDRGLFKSVNFGENIEEVPVISSSKKFPIRALAINPNNPNEIIYSVAHAIYKSTNGGSQWSTFQLETSKLVGKLLYNSKNTSIIYAGLRNF